MEEGAHLPPSPTKSVASNASSAKGIPAAIACKSKEELQRSILDVLKKLKLRDKQIAGTPMGLYRKHIWQHVLRNKIMCDANIHTEDVVRDLLF
eukprot:1159989-Pelagomonas_calceolata.AAC.3